MILNPPFFWFYAQSFPFPRGFILFCAQLGGFLVGGWYWEELVMVVCFVRTDLYLFA